MGSTQVFLHFRYKLLRMYTKHSIDVAIVGSGIMGLAMAYIAAKAGRNVTVFEKNDRAVGATIRNFGMIWPIGQPKGFLLERALRSREIWKKLASEAGFWTTENGSLSLAYREDEWRVLEEFVEMIHDAPYECELITPEKVSEISPCANIQGLRGALWSKTEMIVDPREVPGRISDYLAEKFGVKFYYATAVTHIESGLLFANQQQWSYNQAYVCCGADLEVLFPDYFRNSGVTKCKLQMLRTVPQPAKWRMGPSISGGLTLTHYAAFAGCVSLKALKARIDEESPWFSQWGIHVMMSQNGLGELITGDSHEYGWVHDPFLQEEINQYIMDYLMKMVKVPKMEISGRWYGIYSKIPGKSELVLQPEENVWVVTGLSGAGMTLSWGLAEELYRERVLS